MLEIGPGRMAHPTGALWLPEARAVLIADAHLGYGWAQRRRGELGALNDDVTLDRIAALLAELAPQTVVYVGDFVHAPKPAPEERALVERVLALSAGIETVVIRGNHDRGFEADFGLPLRDDWTCGSLTAIHGHELQTGRGRHVVAGHWHPAFRIRDHAGVTRKLPVFLVSARLTILPAFTPFAAGMNLAHGVPAGLAAHLGGRRRMFAATGRTVMELSKPRRPRMVP